MAGGDGLWWWCSRFRQLVGLPAWCWDVVWIAAYYVIGVLVLAKREGWLYNETIYFLSVTVATVGYGDYSPRTYGGRWFVAVYAPLGVAMVFTTIARHVMTLQSKMRKMTMVLFGVLRLRNAQEERGLPIEEFSPQDVRDRVHYWQRYLACLMPVLTFTLGNTALARFTLGISWSNAVYYSVISCTTIGYGDVGGLTEAAGWTRSLFAGYTLIYVAIFTASIHECFVVRHRQRISSGTEAIPNARELEEMLLLKFARMKRRDVDHGVDPELTEADYIVKTLLNGQFVDPQLLVAIQRSFYWTALGGDGERSTISVDDVHEEHRAEARRQSLTVEHMNFVGEKILTASGHSLKDLRAYAATHEQDKLRWRRDYWDAKVAEIRRHEAGDGDDGRAARRILAKDRFLRAVERVERVVVVGAAAAPKRPTPGQVAPLPTCDEERRPEPEPEPAPDPGPAPNPNKVHLEPLA